MERGGGRRASRASALCKGRSRLPGRSRQPLPRQAEPAPAPPPTAAAGPPTAPPHSHGRTTNTAPETPPPARPAQRHRPWCRLPTGPARRHRLPGTARPGGRRGEPGRLLATQGGGAMLCGAPALSSPRCGSGAVLLRDGPSCPSCTGSRAAASSGRGSVNPVVCKHQKVAFKNFGFGLIWLQSH